MNSSFIRQYSGGIRLLQLFFIIFFILIFWNCNYHLIRFWPQISCYHIEERHYENSFSLFSYRFMIRQCSHCHRASYCSLSPSWSVIICELYIFFCSNTGHPVLKDILHYKYFSFVFAGSGCSAICFAYSVCQVPRSEGWLNCLTLVLKLIFQKSKVNDYTCCYSHLCVYMCMCVGKAAILTELQPDMKQQYDIKNTSQP